MSDSFFIDDGYTREETIAAEPGLHPALFIRFRPALSEQRFAFARAQQSGPEEQAKSMAAIIAKHLIEWSATDKIGAKAAIKSEVIRKMQPALQAKVLDLVLGYSGSPQEEADLKN